MPTSGLKRALDRGAATDMSVADDMNTVRKISLDPDLATEEEREAFFADTRSEPFGAYLENMKSGVAEYLVDNGWPHPDECVLVDEGGWRPMTADFEDFKQWRKHGSPAGKRSLGHFYIEKTAEDLSKDWFAAKLYRHMLEIERADGENRDMAIFVFGHTFAIAQGRGLLHDVVRGKSTVRSASRGGIERARAKSPETRRIVETMKSLIEAGHSVCRAAGLAFQRGIGSSQAANRSAWYREKKRATIRAMKPGE